MRLRILLIGIMHIVRSDQRQACLLTHPEQLLVDLRLFRNTMILQFQVEMVRPHDLGILQRHFLSLLIPLRKQRPGYRARQAGAQCDDPFVVFPQQLQIDPGLIIKTFDKSLGYHLDQILIPCLILCQKHQMVVFRIGPAFFLKAALLCHIDLTANDRMDPPFLTGLIKIDDAVHRAVIRDGQAIHPQFLRLADNLVDFRRPVQQAVFRMHM